GRPQTGWIRRVQGMTYGEQSTASERNDDQDQTARTELCIQVEKAVVGMADRQADSGQRRAAGWSRPEGAIAMAEPGCLEGALADGAPDAGAVAQGLAASD